MTYRTTCMPQVGHFSSRPSALGLTMMADTTPNTHRPTINALDAFVQDWRAKLPEELQWNSTDPPSIFINHARLRGKFYGAQYIIHRPLLHLAMMLDEQGGLDQYMACRSESPKPGTMAPPPKEPESWLEWVLKSARTCIEAAKLSTLAFEGIIDHRRLVVTNIFGTIHAYVHCLEYDRRHIY